MKKKLAEASKLSSFRKVAKWLRSITNHLYWTVASTIPGSKERREKWSSLKNHMVNVHNHPQNEIFKPCEHGPLPTEFVVEGKFTSGTGSRKVIIKVDSQQEIRFSLNISQVVIILILRMEKMCAILFRCV